MHALALAAALLLSAGKPSAHAPTKLDKIHTLLELTGARASAESMVQLMGKQMTPEQYQLWRRHFDIDVLIARIASVYDKHFSEADIEGQIAFYRSPVGKKVVQELPAIRQETSEAGQQYALEIIKQIRAEQQAQQPADVPANKP